MFKTATGSGFRFGAFTGINGPSVLSAFSLKTGPTDTVNFALHTGDDPHKVISARKTFLSAFGADPLRLSVVNQEHGAVVAVVSEAEAGRGALDHRQTVEADAILTDRPNLPIMIFTADCLPVFLHDPSRGVCGLVHAGWQGAKKRILGEAIRTAGERFGVKPSDLRVCLGPHIRQCCYEVGREFRDHFRSVFFSGKNGKTYFDLAGPLRKELENSGVPGANVEDSGLCTHCHPEICHSHRRDRTIFRHAALMMLS